MRHEQAELHYTSLPGAACGAAQLVHTMPWNRLPGFQRGQPGALHVVLANDAAQCAVHGWILQGEGAQSGATRAAQAGSWVPCAHARSPRQAWPGKMSMRCRLITISAAERQARAAVARTCAVHLPAEWCAALGWRGRCCCRAKRPTGSLSGDHGWVGGQ